MLLKCEGLTTRVLQIIGSTSPKLERLDIGGNPQLDLVQVF